MIIDFYLKPFPTIDVDDQYYLREQTVEDTAAFFEYYTHPEVGRHILATIPKCLADASAEIHYCRNLFYQRQGAYWTLARKDNDKMVGAIGFYINNHHHRAEITYDLHRDYWRQGLMSRAIKRIMQHAFMQMDIHRIEALTALENTASMAILKKLGYRHEGTLRNYRNHKNRPHDVELLATTPDQQLALLETTEKLQSV
jgi:[ribosomal protein S5]-alanine N-acetyltransferase